MFHWILSGLLLSTATVFAKPPAPTLKKKPDFVKSCESIATNPCFSVKGIGKSYMGMFTGLAIEPHDSYLHYSVYEVSLEAIAPRKNCDLKMNCIGEFKICPINGPRIHNRPAVCLQSMSHITHTPTEAGSFKLYQ